MEVVLFIISILFGVSSYLNILSWHKLNEIKKKNKDVNDSKLNETKEIVKSWNWKCESISNTGMYYTCDHNFVIKIESISLVYYKVGKDFIPATPKQVYEWAKEKVFEDTILKEIDNGQK